MRKLLISLLVVGLLLGGGFFAENVSAQDIVEVDVAMVGPLDLEQPVPAPPAILKFQEFLESTGRFNVNIYDGGQLGDTSSVYDQLKQGVVQMQIDAEAGTVGSMEYYPLQIFSAPFTFNSEPQTYHIAGTLRSSELVSDMSDDMAERTGARVVAVYPKGFRHLTNSVKEITSPDDLSGLGIRVMPSPMQEVLWSSLGADPTAVSFEELYTALETGVVDAQENPYTVISEANVHEVQDYLTTTGHVVLFDTALVNEDFYQNLSDNDRKLFIQGIELFYDTVVGAAIVENVKQRRFLEEHLEIYDLTPEEQEAFVEKGRDEALEFLRDDLGEDEFWLDRLIEELEAYEDSF